MQGGRLVILEGDPDHPINLGALCSKGQAARGCVQSPYRVTKGLYRAPGSDRGEEKDWEWARGRIARLSKDTRDRGWVEVDDQGQVCGVPSPSPLWAPAWAPTRRPTP